MGTALEEGQGPCLQWLMATRTSKAAVAAETGVDRIVGYEERSPSPVERIEYPTASVVLILELGAPLCVDGLETFAGRRPGSFVAGLQSGPTRTWHSGSQCCIQLNLRPTVAARVLGPARQVSGQVVPLSELSRSLRSEALAAESWPERMRTIEAWLRRRVSETEPSDPRMVWAEEQLLRRGGRLRIRRLHQALNMSERAFTRRFESAVGVAPKRFARLARFARTRELLRSQTPLVDAAFEAGFSDQAHMTREVRAWAGVSPRVLRTKLA